MADQENDGKTAVRIQWELPDDDGLQFVNQFVVQHQEDEFFLSVGTLVLPTVLGTADEREEQIRQLDSVRVGGVSRFGMTRRRLVELIGALQTNLEMHDKRFAREGQDEPV